MKTSYLITLLFTICVSCISPNLHSADTVEAVFEKFFQQPFEPALGHGSVRIVVGKQFLGYESIPVKLQFDIDGVEKVLLLKLKQTGYFPDGVFRQECADESVYIASFVVDPARPVREIATRFETSCFQHEINLLLWVKTKDGKIYSTRATTHTVYESPG